MKLVDIVQRTPKWDAWRLGSITGSDAPVLSGVSPYKTEYRLWQEKSGRALPVDLSTNPFVQRGVLFEHHARIIFEKRINDLVLPVCIESEVPRIKCSLDGLTSNNIPVEFKCPSEKVWNDLLAKETNSESYKLYYPQVQHQIFCVDSAYGYLVFLSPDGCSIKVFIVQRDDIAIKRLLNRYDTFFEYLDKKTSPPLDPQRDIYIPRGDDAKHWSRLSVQYRLQYAEVKKHKSQFLNAQEKLDLIKKQMNEKTEGFSKVNAAGVSLVRYCVSGSVDYKRIVDERLSLSEQELNLYRKNPTENIRITVRDQRLPEDIVDPEIQDEYKWVPVVARPFINL